MTSDTLGDTVKGVRSLEAAVEELPEWIILRYGLLYGPGTWYSRIGPFADAVRQGGRPAGNGVSSFVHVEDAARRRCSRSTGPRVSSTSSTTNLLRRH